MTLETPFGSIIVELNDESCDYRFEALPTVIHDNNGEALWCVDGRYKITPTIGATAAFPLKLRCRINGIIKPENLSGMESGERYASIGVYHSGIKLSVGCYDDIDPELKRGDGYIQVIGGGCVCCDYTTTSIEIFIGAKEYLEYACFGVAWVTLRGDDFESNGENDVWFLAEP